MAKLNRNLNPLSINTEPQIGYSHLIIPVYTKLVIIMKTASAFYNSQIYIGLIEDFSPYSESRISIIVFDFPIFHVIVYSARENS